MLVLIRDPARDEGTCLTLVKRLVHLATVAFDADAVCLVDRRQSLWQQSCSLCSCPTRMRRESMPGSRISSRVRTVRPMYSKSAKERLVIVISWPRSQSPSLRTSAPICAHCPGRADSGPAWEVDGGPRGEGGVGDAAVGPPSRGKATRPSWRARLRNAWAYRLDELSDSRK